LGRSDPVEGYLLSMRDNLVLLAVSTSFYVVRYPLTHSCPIVCLACFSNGFVSSGVSGRRMVMHEGHQLLFGRFGRGRDDLFNEQFWFQECLIFIVVLSLVGIGWSR